MKRVKISELPTIGTTAGMYTIATDKDNRSCKIALDSLRNSWTDLTDAEKQEVIDAVAESISIGEPQSITEEEIKALLSMG